MSSGTEAQRGDLIRRHSDNELGEVRGYSQFGTILVFYPWLDATIKTERYAVSVIRNRKDR